MSSGVARFRAHRFFHQLSPGKRVVLSQLPLTLTMVLVLAIVLVFHQELLLDPVFLYGLAFHGMLFILAAAIPWLLRGPGGPHSISRWDHAARPVLVAKC